MKVYKASAGSGKTFRLTVEYLKIILLKPTHYKKILAITFTNKATAEMKGRILSELHVLAKNESSKYIEILTDELGLSRAEITQRAAQAEQYILHDYTRFSVMTIDAFFQTILKAFSKELGVSYNYNVELDELSIRELAVERMFSQLSEDKELRGWLKTYMREKIDGGRSWNITADVLALSGQLFKENLLFFDKSQKEKFSDKKYIQKLSKAIYSYIELYEKSLFELGQKAMTLIEKNELSVADFSQKAKGVAGLFEKLKARNIYVGLLNSYHAKALDNPEGWYSKSAKQPIKSQIDALYPELNEVLGAIFKIIEEKEPSYQSCKLVQKNLYLMGILSDVAAHIYQILYQQEKILLSESNKLLYELIAENEAPFIYEKTGSQYLYFLWDEFQDTSGLQWHNLKPLLANSLAEGHPCLIVGDIKQAIYRWRNSDWKILAEGVEKDFAYVEEITMQDNWRSDSRIVQFNNALFSFLPKALEAHLGIENPKLQEIYADAIQQPKGKGESGFVHFSYLLKQDECTDRELILKQLVEWVERLQLEGVAPYDIVFLVRKNSEAIAIADFFAGLKDKKQGINYDVVSDFALLLENSLIVKILVNALYFYQDRESFYLANLESLMEYFPSGQQKLESWLVSVERGQKNTSISQILQQLILHFELHLLEKEELYLMEFQEFVMATVEGQTHSLPEFLAIWEQQKGHLSVTPSERIPAMQVMTAHKAKGLEFHTVILPFIDKDLDQVLNGDTFWQEANFTPLENAGSLLVPFSKKQLLSSTFAHAYLEEMHQRYIDELNVFYVATTRAVHNLIMLAPETTSGTRLTTFLYEKLTNSLEDNFWKGWDEQTRAWNYGQIVCFKKEETAAPKVLKQKHLFHQNYLEKFPLKASGVDERKRKTLQGFSPIEEGSLWHHLLEEIYSFSDVEKVVKRAYYSGELKEKSVEVCTEQLKKLLSREEIRPYYAKGLKVWNERMLWAEKETFIPDRVVQKDDELAVIEYKFGELHTNAHKKQLQKYMDFFSQKGFENIKGFLVYGADLDIVCV